MPDFERLKHMNPALLARRIEATERLLERLYAVLDAEAARLVSYQETIGQQGAYVTVLVRALGGRFEISLAELQQIQRENTMRVHYSYPTEERPTFVMVLARDGEGMDDAEKTRAIEARLRAAGVSDQEIEDLRRLAAERIEPPQGTTPPVPGENVPAPTLVDAQGRPARPDPDDGKSGAA
jgi:hypothetical protein